MMMEELNELVMATNEEVKVRKITKAKRLKDHGKSYMNKTSLDGLSQINDSEHKCRKMAWLTVFILGVTVCSYYNVMIFVKYFAYKTTTSLKTIAQLEAEMPAITLCNVNPVSEKGLVRFSKDTALNFTYPLPYDEMKSKFAEIWSELDSKSRKMLGYEIDDMLKKCTFANVACTEKDLSFRYFYDWDYGNCYSIHSIEEKNRWITGSSGKMKGALTLLINIEEESQKIYHRSSLGVALLIHNISYVPLVSDVGMVLSPGFSWSLSMQREDTMLMEPPYDLCHNFPGEDLFRVHAWIEEYPYIEYTRDACYLTCFQKKLMEICGCYDEFLPHSGKTFEGTVEKPCFLPETKTCYDDILKNFTKSKLNCSESCPIMCNTVDFKVTPTAALFPNPANWEEYLQYLTPKQIQDENGNDKSSEELYSIMRKNLVEVTVYYSTLDIKVIDQEAQYTHEQALADLGGQLGLWLGLSMMGMVEVAELILDFFNIIMRKKVK